MADYKIMVDDNFHHMDVDERYELGVCATVEEAVATCRGVVDRSLLHQHKAGMTAAELFKSWKDFGDYPFVVPPPGTETVAFSAWTYAKEQAQSICGPAAPEEMK